MLHAYVHTRNDIVIEIEPTTRIPPNQVEFLQLMGRLLDGGEVEGYKARNMTFRSLMNDLDVSMVIAMSPDGQDVPLSEVMGGHEDLAVIVGAFPCGDYRGPVYELADLQVSLGPWLMTVPAVVSECARLMPRLEKIVGKYLPAAVLQASLWVDGCGVDAPHRGSQTL